MEVRANTLQVKLLNLFLFLNTFTLIFLQTRSTACTVHTKYHNRSFVTRLGLRHDPNSIFELFL